MILWVGAGGQWMESLRGMPHRDTALHGLTPRLCPQTWPPRLARREEPPPQPVPAPAEPSGKPEAQTVQPAVSIWASCPQSPPAGGETVKPRLGEPHDQSGAW